MKMLLDVIAELQALYEKHGNLPVVKHDCEWGLEVDFEPKVEKVWEEHGHLTSYSEEMIAERRRTAAEVFNEQTIRESYDSLVESMKESGFEETQTFEEWRDMMLKVPIDAAETVAKYDAAPNMVVL